MPTLSNQNIVLTQDLLHVPSDHLLDRGRLCYDQLKTVLQFHEHRYYILNDPLISDFESKSNELKLKLYTKLYHSYNTKIKIDGDLEFQPLCSICKQNYNINN